MSCDKNSFTLKSTNNEFSKRQKNVFDQLNVLESNRATNRNLEDDQMDTVEATIIENDRRDPRMITKNYRGKESIFKKPQNPVPKNFINRIPDFKKNPHKWTRYSLEDVRDEDISDKGNSKAALSFLRELRERKERETVAADSSDAPTNKIFFKKHTSIGKKTVDDPEEAKPSFRSSKLVMPEYVVGHKAKKEKKNRALRNSSKRELKLDHLEEVDDE